MDGVKGICKLFWETSYGVSMFEIENRKLRKSKEQYAFVELLEEVVRDTWDARIQRIELW